MEDYKIQDAVVSMNDYETVVGQIENFIGVFPDLYTEDYCDSVIDLFHKSCSAGFGYKHSWNVDRQDSVVFSNDCLDMEHGGEKYGHFLSVFWSKAYKEYTKKYGVLDRSGKHAIFSCKLQKTEVSEGFHAFHFDANPKNLSNRILVFLLYLNDVDEGGETEFLYMPKRVKPKKGTLLVFPASFTHTHRGNPPISNTKYVLTGWVEF